MHQQLADLREEVMYVIFLDLRKAYDALDRSRCLGILERYSVGPQARRLPLDWPWGGDVEGSDGNFKSPAHGLHHLP